jgi:hypothetical protein
LNLKNETKREEYLLHLKSQNFLTVLVAALSLRLLFVQTDNKYLVNSFNKKKVRFAKPSQLEGFYFGKRAKFRILIHLIIFNGTMIFERNLIASNPN